MISLLFMMFAVISHFQFLILLVWVFSLLILVRFARGLSILFIFSQNQLFDSLILCMVFYCFYFTDFSPYLNNFFPSCFGIFCSCFSRSLNCSIRSLISDLSDLLVNALIVINFPLRTSFAVSHSSGRSCFHFH
jgi:hypothetical protein